MAATQSMTPSDAMESAESMMIYADYLEERGVTDGLLVRAIGFVLEFAEITLNSKPRPTGSRYYGDRYITRESDWDWYFKVNDLRQSRGELEAAGFTRGGSFGSLYFGGVNVILFGAQGAFKAFHEATLECVRVQPETREDAVAIYERHRADPS